MKGRLRRFLGRYKDVYLPQPGLKKALNFLKSCPILIVALTFPPFK